MHKRCSRTELTKEGIDPTGAKNQITAYSDKIDTGARKPYKRRNRQRRTKNLNDLKNKYTAANVPGAR